MSRQPNAQNQPKQSSSSAAALMDNPESVAAKAASKSSRFEEDRDTLLRIFRQMLLIRRFEEKCAESYSLGKIGGFCHLYIGQEAVGVGAISALRNDDCVLPRSRPPGQAPAKGISA